MSIMIPQYIIPLTVLASRATHLGSASLALLGSSLLTSIILPILTPYHSSISEHGASAHPWALYSPVTRWWSYSWITPFIVKSYFLKSDVSVKDLPPLAPDSAIPKWSSDFASVRSECSSSGYALFRMFYPRLASMALLMVFCGLSEFLGAIGLRNLLLHLEKRTSAATFTPWFSIFLFGVSPIVRGLFMQTFEFYSTDAICHLKGIVISDIYQRILASKPGAKPDVGQVSNYISADIDKLTTLRYTIMAMFMVPVEVLVATVLLYQTLGWSCLPGLGIMLVPRVPISWYSSKFQGAAQSQVMSTIDARVRRVTEAIQGLQTIKMLGQGASFVRWIDEKRNADLHALRHKWIVVVLSESISNMFVLVPLVLSLALYTLIVKESLDPSVVFTVLSVFNTLQKMLGLTVIGASTYAQSMVSLGRLVGFLDDNLTTTLDESLRNDVSESSGIFGCKNATILVQDHQGRIVSAIHDANFDLVRGGLNLVLGKTGCVITEWLPIPLA